MSQRWVPVVIVVVGGLLGLAIAGLPSRREDAPLRVQTATTTVVVGSTAPPAPSTSAPPAVRRPADVRVTAFNASRVRGTAGRMSTKLKSLGYNVLPASADRTPQATSVVMFRGGSEAEARALAGSLGLDAGAVAAIDPAVQATAPETELAVVVGDDLARSLQ
ncbi:MAG TPA: LytR C-terminal domain-containing protein [Acidimicrobiales bacterium]|nr:LytR C-terminal domain-containing protein [Acidimicrobiales bacterium]